MASIKSKDARWSRKVRDRENDRCQIGLKGCLVTPVQGMHIIGRGHMELRWDLDNGIAGCSFCHGECDGKKVNFIDMIERITPEQFRRLRVKYKRFYKRDIYNYG
jgi:hypothetical protein